MYVYAARAVAVKTGMAYPGNSKFSDEGGDAIKGNLIHYIEPGSAADNQYDRFASNSSTGLTQAGLSRLNQSMEAFVYCILGTQVNVRRSILSSRGRVKGAQSEFLALLVDAIRQPDLAKSVERYQLAVDEVKVRLNLSVCTGAWLMPARMVINTECIVGYNNHLKQAVQGMKLRVEQRGEPRQKSGRDPHTHMEGRKSKIDRPNSHPSNIHKTPREPATDVPVPDKNISDQPTAHENNKIWLITGLGLGAFAVSCVVL